MMLRNVLFPPPAGAEAASPPTLWDVRLVDGVVESIAPAEDRRRAGDDDGDDDDDDNAVASQLLLPPLCHPHLHLDKAYLLTGGCCGGGGGGGGDGDEDAPPSYADLVPQTGSFAEALQTTAAAQARFTAADLRRRGAQLLATSCAQGVAAARVFVEVDAQAAGRGAVAVAAAAALRRQFRGRLALQVCAFAQEPLFTGAAGDANRAALEDVLAAEANSEDDDDDGDQRTIAVLGVTPYVEATRAQALQNIDWAVATAQRFGLHLDLHLDYNLRDYAGRAGDAGDADREPLVFALVDALVRHNWTAAAAAAAARTKTVVVGHATQLTRLPPAQLRRLAAAIRDHSLPLHLVGLPTSDLYMMGRPQPPPPPPAADSDESEPCCAAPRGTLPVPTLVRRFGLRACLGVNNVGNAFTPHGTGDPLQLACWGVGLYHAGTPADAMLLYGSVSWRAREAIGLVGAGDGDGDGDGEGDHLDWQHLDPAALAGKRIGPVLAVTNRRYIAVGSAGPPLGRIPARPRSSFRDVVWDPPDVSLRRVVL